MVFQNRYRSGGIRVSAAAKDGGASGGGEGGDDFAGREGGEERELLVFEGRFEGVDVGEVGEGFLDILHAGVAVQGRREGGFEGWDGHFGGWISVLCWFEWSVQMC